MKCMYWGRWLLCAALLWSAGTACSDAATGQDGPTDVGPRDPLNPELVDMAVVLPPAPGTRELQLIGQRDRLVFFSQSIEIQVKYIDSAMRGIPNATVNMRLYDERGIDQTATGIEGNGLRSSRAVTDAQGIATFEFIAAERAIVARLEASTPDTSPIEMNLTVAREGAGALNVRVSYNTDNGRYGFGDLKSADVALFDRDDCELLIGSATDLRGAFLALPPIDPFNEVDNQVSVNDLDDGAEFSVAVVVRGATGNVVGFGCGDGITIVGGQVTEAVIEVTDLPLQFKGKFTVVNKFDLTDLLRATENDTLNTVAEVLDVLRILGSGDGERGRALIHLLCDLVNLDDGICRIIEPIGGRLLENAIERFVPESVLRVLTVISDILTIAQELTTVGEIEFTQSTVDENGRLIGNDNRWQKFRFEWRNGCPEGADCRREFTIGDIDRDRRPIAGVFGATLEGQQLIIDAHHLTFRYGLILLGLAENWLIPAIVDSNVPVGIEELFANLLPCRQINGLLGDENSGLCEDVLVTALADVIIDQLGRLDFEPEQFEITGTAIPLDTDGDLQIDMLDEGRWVGVIHIGEQDLPFNGCFKGCRDMECPPPDCEVPDVE